MKRILLPLLLILSSINAIGQSKALKGRWFIDKILYSNGNGIDITDPWLSSNMTYTILLNELRIQDMYFTASYTSDQIDNGFVKMNYQFEGLYLKVQYQNDDRVLYFLKQEDFLEKYPEFTPQVKIIRSDTLLIANDFVNFEFKNELSFYKFLHKNGVSTSSKYLKDLYFQIEFMLSKDNKIKDIQVLNTISDQYDKQYIQALKKSERYFRNHTGKDILFTQEMNHFKPYYDLTTIEEKTFYDIKASGDSYYKSKQFENAIIEYSKIDDLNLKEDQYKIARREALINLGISYLSLNNTAKACEYFNRVGNNTNFFVRLYLNLFCVN